MKKNILWMLASILTCGLLLTACSNHDDAVDNGNNPGPATEKEFTIIYYGNGGSNLDSPILTNICQMYDADKSSYDKVNIVVLYKMSQRIDEEADYIKYIKTQTVPGFKFEKGTTYRFAVDPEKYYSKERPQMQFTEDNIYGGKGNTVDIGQADTLCNYIKWAVR